MSRGKLIICRLPSSTHDCLSLDWTNPDLSYSLHVECLVYGNSTAAAARELYTSLVDRLRRDCGARYYNRTASPEIADFVRTEQPKQLNLVD